MLTATLDAKLLKIEFKTPQLETENSVSLVIDAQIEQKKLIVREISLNEGEEFSFDDDQGIGTISLQNQVVQATFSKIGDFRLTDTDAMKEGDEGNISIEVKNTETNEKLCLWTILAIGPAPRTTTTNIRLASDTALTPAEFGQ